MKTYSKKIYTSFSFLFLFFTLFSQTTAPELERSFYSPVKIQKIDEGHYFIDFGKAFFGTLNLDVGASQAEPITIHLGEKLTQPNAIDRNPPGTIRYQKVVLPELSKGNQILKLVADKRNSTPPAVLLPDSVGVIMPFRYCEIENLKIPIEELTATQVGYHYRFNDDASSFTSSDTTLNRVWDLCKHTIKATSFAGYYIDGDRERIPYEADAYINQLSHYALDSVYSIARRTNEYFIDHPTWPTEWQLHVALMFYADYLYTGNTELIKTYYEQLKAKTLIDLVMDNNLITIKSKNNNGGLMQQLGFKDTTQRLNDIVDWPRKGGFGGVKGEADGYQLKPYNTVINSLFYRNMMIMAEFAKILDKPEDVSRFTTQAQKTKEAINDLLWDESQQCYRDGIGTNHAAVHANMFPLAMGVVPENRTKQVADFIKTRGMACSVYGAQYLLEALYMANEAKYALELMTATHDRSWYNMIRIGSTMTLEAWDLKYKPNLDWNHAWGTAPANIISRFVWGITPTTPGYSTINIQPQWGGLTESNISVPTPHGSLLGSYSEIKNKIYYTLEIPADTEATLYLPLNIKKVFVNNKKLPTLSESIKLQSGNNIVIITLK